jgi:ureidoglycolate dehydrogenase (NAD+)
MGTYTATELTEWTERILAGWGYGRDDAEYLAGTLVDANARGVDSHGVLRLPAYERRIAERLVDPIAQPIVSVHQSIVTVDANGAAGQFAARSAADAALAVSRNTGVAVATVTGSTHFGMAGFYARWLADRGAIGIVVSNSEPIVVPFGGKRALLGTNPFAFAAPTFGAPISLDMATSTAAMGKIFLAQASGASIPSNWGVDKDGNPTTDPSAVSALLPMGGPKGYGLGFLVEVLGGVLTGSAISHGIGDMYNDFSRTQNVGHWVLAIDIEHFMPLDHFKNRIQSLVDLAHATEPADGFDRVQVPGEPEERINRERRTAGIPIPPSTVDELRQLGDRFGCPFPIGVPTPIGV